MCAVTYCTSEIEIPKEFEILADDEEEEEEQFEKEDTWNDLGLSKFLQDANGQNSDPKE